MRSACQDCEPHLRALMDGELGREETARVWAHLDACASCRETLAAVQEVSRLVGGLPAEIEPPPHFGASLQVRLAGLRARDHRLAGVPRGPRWSRRYSLAGLTVAGTVLALVLGAPPRLGAQDLVGKVQESWKRLQSFSCRFVAEGMVRGRPRRFEQRQWFCKPNLFRLETNEHFPEETYLETDRVTTFIPGATWRGKRVAIVRPRRSREAGLPFPFGAEWPAAFDVTMDALVRELQAQQGGELLGMEEVLGKPCHVLKFFTRHPGDRLPTHYKVWVDQESLLPLKVKTYLNTENHTLSTAVDLQTNVMVPANTFRFQPRPDTLRIYGEVEPFVFALRPQRPRPEAFDTEPAAAARAEMLQRAAWLPFQPLAPACLPPGYGLVRVRAARDRWLDAYWVNSGTGAVIKLLEQSAAAGPGFGTLDLELWSAPIQRTVPRLLNLRWREVRRPAPIQYLTWTQSGARLSMAAAGVERDEALRIAASVTPVSIVPERT